MTVMKGEPNGTTSIHDTIRCDMCSAGGPPKKTLSLSANAQNTLANLFKNKR